MITELSFEFGGRYGNNIISLMNMIKIHKKNINSYLLIPSRSKVIKQQIINIHNTTKTTHFDYVFTGIEKKTPILNNKIQKQKIHNSYWIGYNNYRINDYPSFEEKISYLPIIKQILNIKDKKYISDNDLLIHIRSGDIYKKNPHKSYAQPPISFYHKIISTNNFSHIYIITDNNNNFIYKELKNNYGNKLSLINENKVPEAFNIIRNATNICTSTSSFCLVATLLKPINNNKNIYTYTFVVTEHVWGFNRLFDFNLDRETFNFNIYDINNYLYMTKKNNLTDGVEFLKNKDGCFIRNWTFDESTKNIMLNHKIDDIVQL